MPYQTERLGRRPRYPDPRDYSPAIVDHLAREIDDKAKKKIISLKIADVKTDSHSNKALIPQVEDQGNWGSCVGFGCNYAMSMIMSVVAKRAVRFSARYTYRLGRYIAGLSGDSGLWVKNGLGSLVRYGAVEEFRYPYDTSTNIDDKVDPDLHPLAEDIRGSKYFRLDYPNITRGEMITRINKYISQKFPVVCGFYCFDTIFHRQTDQSGAIPYPTPNEGIVGGHCICLTGYDKNKEVVNPLDGLKTVGAWQFVNSWSEHWGESGYGWLPFDYLVRPLNGEILADEFYVLTKAEWLQVWDFE